MNDELDRNLALEEEMDQDSEEVVEIIVDQAGGGELPSFDDFEDPNCLILGQNVKHFPKFNMTGTELEVKITNDITEGLTSVTERVLSNVAPDDMVQIILRSTALEAYHTDIVLSFRRRDQIDIAALLDEISENLYDDEEQLFFMNPVVVIFSIVRLPRGHGRGSKKGIETFSAFSRNKRAIVTIRNTDKLCLARAISVGIAFCDHTEDSSNTRLKATYNTLRNTKENNPSQRAAALELCAKAGVRVKDCGTPESLRKFRDYLKDYDILVYQIKNNLPTLVLDSRITENPNKRKICLLNENNHFNLITKLGPLFGKTFFCSICLEGYRRASTHRCADYCFSCCRELKCVGDIKKCSDCLRDFVGADCFAYHKTGRADRLSLCESLYHCKDCVSLIDLGKRNGQQHQCYEEYCGVCKKYQPAGHLCYIQVIKEPPRPPAVRDSTGRPTQVYVFYDFECIQVKRHEEKTKCFIHEPLLCVSETYCVECLDRPPPCRFCGDRQREFLGGRCVNLFFDYLRTLSKVRSVILLGHNASNYDTQLLLQVIMDADSSFVPETIINGTRILQMRLHNLQFNDSYNFVPIPLSKFAATFELGENYEKNFFPHFLFNCVENNFDINKPWETNYILAETMPPIEAYGVNRFTAKDRQLFDRWYKAQCDNKTGFNYVETLVKYCKQDTTILAAGCLKFMKIFQDLCQVNPFQVGVAIASVCSHVLRKKFLKENSIGIIPASGYRLSENQSRECLEWLAWESHERKVNISSAMTGKEPRAGKIRIDGLFDGKNAMQFHGCWFHGCLTCFGAGTNRAQPLHNNFSDNMNVRLTNTMKTTNRLKDMGYTVVEKWGCDWTKEKADKPEIAEFLKNSNFYEKFSERLDPRAAFYGGRVSALRTYCSVIGTNDKILAVDICSLYPFINKRGKVPLGHPKILLENIPDVFQFEGLLKCDVLPPTNLFHPVLPYRTNYKKLVFALCRTCCETRFQGDCHHTDAERTLHGTWVVDELRHALRRGYVITKSYEAWVYDVTQYNPETGEGGLFREYVDCFLKSKQEASGWPAGCATEEEKADYVAAFENAEGVKLDPSKIAKNEGLRAISKLLLNSMWGKLGQRSRVTKTEIIKEPKIFFELLLNPEAEVKSVLTINDETLLVKWAPVKEADIPLKHTNCVIAAYTTAQARLVLLGYLEKVGEAALYYDTDSLYYLAKDGIPLIETSNLLGSMVDELTGYGEGAYIEEMACGGPKNYSYWVKNPTTGDRHNVMKCKGFRVDATNQAIINGENLKALIGVDESPIDPLVVPLPRQIRLLPDHTLVSTDLHKIYRPLIDKVRLLPNHRTVPYGFRSQ